LATYLLREMPPGTVVGNPAWWAARIAAAIERELPGRFRAQGGNTNDSNANLAAPTAGAATTSEDARDAARWRFMMAAVDSEQGPERLALEQLKDAAEDEDARPESVQMAEIVDAAMRATQQEGE
jgi:hypothetical protein